MVLLKKASFILSKHNTLWQQHLLDSPLHDTAVANSVRVHDVHDARCYLNVTIAAVQKAEGPATFPASSRGAVLIDDTPWLDGSRRMSPRRHIRDLQPTSVSRAIPHRLSSPCIFTLSFFEASNSIPVCRFVFLLPVRCQGLY